MVTILKNGITYAEGQKCIACSAEKGNDNGGRFIAVQKIAKNRVRGIMQSFQYWILNCSRCSFKLVPAVVENKRSKYMANSLKRKKEGEFEKRLKYTH